jgi:ATP-dependent exoDNAse (exonuclease V) beta subunit
MEGVIDLVVVNSNDDVWVIDWKTNQHMKAEDNTTLADQLRQQYLPQLEAYKKVIENGLQRSVTRLLLYSTVLGRFV